MRHLEAAELWIQEVFRSGRASLLKINGKANPADLFTKYLARNEIVTHMSFLGFRLFDAANNEIGIKDVTLQMVEGERYEDATENDEAVQLATFFEDWSAERES